MAGRVSRRELAEIAREMGLRRFNLFVRDAERRLMESVRDCENDKPRSKAETTRSAIDGYTKLAGIGKQLAEDQLAWQKVADYLSGRDAARESPQKIEIVLEDQAEPPGEPGGGEDPGPKRGD
jgi:hypothetical protein